MYFYPLNPEANRNAIYPYYGMNPQLYIHSPRIYTEAQVSLINEMRMLWEQHGVWTRAAIMSIALDLPDESVVLKRLLQNPKDFANTLNAFYSDRIASRFGDLLTDHLVIAAELVKAAKAGNNKGAEAAEKRWYTNADEIADFLGSINPYWSQEEWRDMLHHHLALVKAEAVAMLTKDFEAGVKVYDEIERQALVMADVMAEGIIRQFSVY